MIESVSIRRADRTDIPAIVGIQDSALKAVQDPGRAFSLEAWQAFFDAPGTFTYMVYTRQCHNTVEMVYHIGNISVNGVFF